MVTLQDAENEIVQCETVLAAAVIQLFGEASGNTDEAVKNF